MSDEMLPQGFDESAMSKRLADAWDFVITPQHHMVIVPCDNPDCDLEDGCCNCEHTGRIAIYVLQGA